MAMDGPVHEHVEVREANLRQCGLDGLLERHHDNTRAKQERPISAHACKAAVEQRREGQGREATKNAQLTQPPAGSSGGGSRSPAASDAVVPAVVVAEARA